MPNITEKSIFFRSHKGFLKFADYELWACLNHVTSCKNNKICVILCNPLLDERITCHPYFVYFANYLSQNGISSLRFDYSGTGESMPPMPTYSLDHYAHQVESLVDFLRNTTQFETIGLFGVSNTSLVFSKLVPHSTVDFCIYWEPVLKAQQYIKTLFRANILEQQTVFKAVKYNSAQLSERLQDNQDFIVEGHRITEDFINSIDQDFSQSILNCDFPLRIEFFKRSSFNYAMKLLEDNCKQNISCIQGSMEAMFWRSAVIKYLELPLQSMKESVKWIQTRIV